MEDIDSTLDTFIDEVIEPNGLAFDGSGYLQWEGLICLRKIGHRTGRASRTGENWLEAQTVRR